MIHTPFVCGQTRLQTLKAIFFEAFSGHKILEDKFASQLQLISNMFEYCIYRFRIYLLLGLYFVRIRHCISVITNLMNLTLVEWKLDYHWRFIYINRQ
jgi:hypothetical protein